ncbi:uncharacterized protein [Temnothorax nylanderi]|uniref:uncharacterized protein n=1 Tax=Temnothorax nylanderi TaxID=102681 RepID=UPI003A8952E0
MMDNSLNVSSSYWNVERTRKIISLVRNNIILYAKGTKMFKDKQAKDLAWQSIGATLDPPCVGDVVARRFKHLRDTFQREKKKILCSIPSSGAGVQDGDTRYHSSWEYYNDLLFLSEHINSRKTISNYVGLSASSSPFLTQSSEIQSDENLEPNQNLLKRKASQSFVEEIEEIQDKNIVYEDVAPVLIQASSSDESILTNEPSTSGKMTTNETITSIRGKAVQSILDAKIPNSNIKKKERNEDFLKNCLQQLATSATKVATKITCPEESVIPKNTEELQFLQYLLRHVPEDKKILCISDFFRIAEIHRKGKSPHITEI